MISGFLYIVGDHVLKRQHSLYIKISRSCNKIALVRIFTGQLKSDKMTTIIQIFSVHKIVLDRMPAGRLDLSDAAALFGRHNILPDRRDTNTAAPECIKLRVILERDRCYFILGKIGIAAAHRNIRLTRVRWQRRKVKFRSDIVGVCTVLLVIPRQYAVGGSCIGFRVKLGRCGGILCAAALLRFNRSGRFGIFAIRRV